jgi:cation transport ATPase
VLSRLDGPVAVYFEAAAVIVSLTLLGQILEEGTVADLGGDQVAAGARPEDGAAHRRRRQ